MLEIECAGHFAHESVDVAALPWMPLRIDTMKVGFVVNQIETEQASYTTTRLAMAAVNRGHEAWLIGTGDLALDPDDYVRARARAAPKAKYKSLDTLSGRAARAGRPIGANHGRRPRRAHAAERPGRGHRPAAMGANGGHPVRPGGAAARRDRAERPDGARAGRQQDVLPAVSRGSAAGHAHHPRSQRDPPLRQGARRRPGDQAAAGLRRPGRFPGSQKRPWQPEPDDRGGQPRRLRDRPGIPARCGRGRHAAVRHERGAAEI